MAETKHALEHKWSIWYDSKKTIVDQQDWEKNLQKVTDFETVEEFWCVYNHIKKPTALEFGANYHMFQCGVKPMWEDVENKEGGRFLISLKGDTDRLNEIWEHLLLSIIGETLEEGVTPLASGKTHVTGAVLGRRKAQTKLSIWTRDRNAKEALEELKVKLIKVLELRGDTDVQYAAHQH